MSIRKTPTKSVFNSQAEKLEELIKSDLKPSNENTKFIAITSGKGGVGKSAISANLGFVLSNMGFKVALFDADIGLANLDVILNVKSSKNILHVLKGEATLQETVVKVNDNLFLIPGDSGNEILKYSTGFVFDHFIDETKTLDGLDFMIIDTGAGIGESVQRFLNASDYVIVITTPDPTAITDAYAMIKVIADFRDDVYLLVNMAREEKEAISIHEKINRVAQQKFAKDFKIELLGFVCKDDEVQKSVKKRELFCSNQYLKATENLTTIAKGLAAKMERKVLDNTKEKGFSRFIKKLLTQL